MRSTETPEQTQETLTFSARGVRAGFLDCLPIALGVAGYGVVFGVLARDAGLSVAEAALMSGAVLAGAAQLIAIDLWQANAPVGVIVLTTFVVNLRYLLMGAALYPWFRKLSGLQAYGSVFFTADENWALTIRELRDGRRQGAFLLGSGLAVWLFWVVATVVGATASGRIDDPSMYGLDFVLTAVFLTLLVGVREDVESFLPWIVAAGVAAAGTTWLSGQWYILLGGIAASATEVIQYD